MGPIAVAPATTDANQIQKGCDFPKETRNVVYKIMHFVNVELKVTKFVVLRGLSHIAWNYFPFCKTTLLFLI